LHAEYYDSILHLDMSRITWYWICLCG